MPQTLTDLYLKKLTAGDTERIEVWDDKIPGFGVRVSKTGTKTFILMYRQHGKSQRLSLGRYPDLQLADARKQARSALVEATSGQTPKSEAPTKRPERNYGYLTVVEQFIELHCKRHNRKSTVITTSSLLRSAISGEAATSGRSSAPT